MPLLLDDLIAALQARRKQVGNAYVGVQIDAHSQTIHGKPAAATLYDIELAELTALNAIPVVVLTTRDEFAVVRNGGDVEPI